MLRGLRRRLGAARGTPLARFTIRVLAVSPFPDEPIDEEDYFPSLIVETIPPPEADEIAPDAFAMGALLFVEWAYQRSEEVTLLVRLRALLPRLGVAVKVGRVGPAAYAAHRAGQRENFYHHREAATYDVALHRDDAGLYLNVKRRVADGRWTEAATLLEAATLAPYEALLRVDQPTATAMLAWLARAAERWYAENPADFPVAAWDPAGSLAPPGGE